MRARLAAAALPAAVALGIALRLIWPADIEWKSDEQWTFAHARAVAAGGEWRWDGMPMSVGPPNPGMSLWVFAALARLTEAATPPELARAVHLCNAAALVVLWAFVLSRIAPPDRERWSWAVALVALNPVLIVLERKIWPPSVLPLFVALLLWAWSWRARAAGAFAWGAIGAAMSQVHVAAAAFVLAIAAWTAMGSRRDAAWGWWWGGTTAGLLPLVPWLPAFTSGLAEARLAPQGFNPTLYLRWLTQSIGVDAHYTLGAAHFREYLRGPIVGGVPTHLIGAVHVALLAAGLAIAIGAGRAALSRRRDWRRLLLGHPGDGSMWVAAAWWGYLGVLTLAHVNVHRHYLIVAAVPMALSLASAALMAAESRWPRRLLVVVCLGQAAASTGLLTYIHRTQVIVPGEFGATWASQQRAPGDTR